jgi:glycosyltransferase involved in cell wall biosynthesis
LPASFPPEKPPVFLAVGRLVEKKAPLVTLAAFREVVQAFPQARLNMVGDGPLLAACRAFVEQHDLEDRVSFLLARSPDYIAQALQESCCFVQHSVTAADGDSEGTPVAILDAGLAGLPVVSTRHAGIADVVVEGKTGYLVAEHDQAAMAERMKDILRHPETARQMGLNASAHVLKNYAVPVTIAQLRAALQETYQAVTQ